MKIIVGTMLMGLSLSVGHLSKANAGPLPGKRDEVHERFNEVAKDIEVDIRMVLTDCRGITCNYSVTGELGVISFQGEEEGSEIENIVLIFGNGSDATNMILSMGIFMLVYSPEVEKDERGAAITQLGAALTGGEDKTSVILGNTVYSLSNLKRMGLWFKVDGRE